MLSLDLCNRAAASKNPATIGHGMAALGVGCPADGSHVFTDGAQSGANGSHVAAAADISCAESDSRRLGGIRRRLRLSTRRLIVLATIVLAVRIFVGEASVVPTASMEGTILVGDHLFMDKLLYGPEIPLTHWRLPALKSVHRGDIVVFHYPKDPSETFLKRVAAIGGDQIEIRDGVLYVNARAVSEPYVVHHGPARSAHETMKPITVPQ